ncbi:MAG: helix-turn-helix domain-containing protein, partial [Pseudonocardiaceae bacterium]
MAKEPVAEFCVRLRALQQYSGLSRAELARRMHCSRSQLYQVLDGEIRRPPDWKRVVEPLVRVCTGDDEGAVREWRQHHGALVRVYDELRRRERPNDRLRPADQMARGVPAQLPADVDGFTGRTAELAELDRFLREGADHPATAVVISAVSGTAGVGKTALALRWAHRVRGEFPDGQLYVDLRGYDPDQPMAAGDALAGFLRALGVAGPDI